MEYYYYNYTRCYDLLIMSLVLTFVVDKMNLIIVVEGLGCNWGTRATHPLPPDIVVRLMKDNGFNKVKIFEVEPSIMEALGNSGIEVMVGIPNDFLAPLASSVRIAEEWVSKNVSTYISNNGVDIRYVAVGNEPFLATYKDTFLQTTLPALKNVQAALIRAGLGRQVKVTVPLNADVYETSTGVPSGGNFRSDIQTLVISIINFLSENNAPLTINIYPFLSLYADPNFPVDYAFFSGASSPVVDGPISYTNVLDANFDTLIWALEKNGFPNLPIIIGEVGWPTDGDKNANIENARRFNQGLFNRIIRNQGTPKRSNAPDIYMFGLIDEDDKSILPGNFERHWGLFYFDGTIKYQLTTRRNQGSSAGTLVPAKNVRYLEKEWCVMRPDASASDANVARSVSEACTYADCTSLGYGSSCGELDSKSNASYAFNMYFQRMNQRKESCQRFGDLTIVTNIDPSPSNTCRFKIMIDLAKHVPVRPRRPSASGSVKLDYGVCVVTSGFIFVMQFISALVFELTWQT